MSEHPAVEFLRQAHERAEELARYTGHDYVWTAKDDTYGPFVQISDTDEYGWSRQGGDSAWTCDDPYDDCASVRAELRDEAKLIAAHADPAVVLRRVAAERQILAMWEDPERVRCLPEGVHDGRDPDEVEADVAAAEAVDQVVLLLAEAWGWTEDRDAAA